MSEAYLGTWHAVGRRCGASKCEHTYMPHYERLLGSLADKPINLLEIGVCSGGSLKMWLELFPKARIYGVDVVNNTPWKPGVFENHIDLLDARAPIQKRLTSDDRPYIHTLDQSDPKLATIFPENFLDVIIDDGSHVFDHQTKARESLWPALKPSGWYFIEDILDLNNLRYWGTFARFRVFMDYLRRSDRVQHCLDDALVVLRKEPCPLPWEW